MQSLTFKIKLAFVGLFFVLSGGLWIYNIYWARPARECEAQHRWWYNPGRECVIPVTVSDITGRPDGRSKAPADPRLAEPAPVVPAKAKTP